MSGTSSLSLFIPSVINNVICWLKSSCFNLCLRDDRLSIFVNCNKSKMLTRFQYIFLSSVFNAVFYNIDAFLFVYFSIFLHIYTPSIYIWHCVVQAVFLLAIFIVRTTLPKYHQNYNDKPHPNTPTTHPTITITTSKLTPP